MTMPIGLLEDAARYVAVPRVVAPFSPTLSQIMLASVLEQRRVLAQALLDAYPAFQVPRHQRAPVEDRS